MKTWLRLLLITATVGGGFMGLSLCVGTLLRGISGIGSVIVLAVAVGIYLPLELSVPIFCGGLIAYLVERQHEVRIVEAGGGSGRRGTGWASVQAPANGAPTGSGWTCGDSVEGGWLGRCG